MKSGRSGDSGRRSGMPYGTGRPGGGNRRNHRKRRKLFLILPVLVCAVLIAACGAYLYFYQVPAPSLTSIMGDRQNAEGSASFENGDSVYTPAKESIAYDEDSHVMYFNNQLIVYTFSEMNDDYASELAGMVNGEVVGKLSGGINALQIRVNASTLEELNAMAAQLMTREDVLFAGYDYPVQMSPAEAAAGTDSESKADSNPWSANPKKPAKDRGDEDHPDGNDWWAEAIGAYTAWQHSGQCKPIKVGIIDDGFDADHEDLAGQISFLPGYTDHTSSDHGTHVAGIIGALNNDKGIRGIADSARLVCVDYSPDDSSDGRDYLSTGEYAEIIKQLVENGVSVINDSWNLYFPSFETIRKDIYQDWNLFPIKYFMKGKEEASMKEAGTYDSFQQCWDTACDRTALDSTIAMIELMLNGHRDFLIVESAGNGEDNGGPGVDARKAGYFCAIDNDVYNLLSERTRSRLSQENIDYSAVDQRILIVGAVGKEHDANGYKMTTYSNYGAAVDICAPGGKYGVFSTLAGNQYGGQAGTSMAAPMVSGSAALVWSLKPELSAPEVRDILLTHTITQAYGVGGGEGDTYPMLNVGAAAQAVSEESASSENTSTEAETAETKETSGAPETTGTTGTQESSAGDKTIAAAADPSYEIEPFRNALSTFLSTNTLPDGSQGYQVPEAVTSGNFADFAVCDVDGDGKDELLISQSYGCTADMCSYIYDYDPDLNSFRLESNAAVFGLLDFYRTGYMSCGENHAQGIGGGMIIWPYDLHQYDPNTDSYSVVCSVDAWDKNNYNESYYGPFPDDKDQDGNGILYVLYPPEGDTFNYSAPEYLDDAEYQAYLSDKTDPSDEIAFQPYILNTENLDRLDEIIQNQE